MAAKKPYSRDEYHRALLLNAALDPFSVVLLAVLLICGIVVSPLLFGVAGVAYLASAARTYFDQDAADTVLARERAKHREEPAMAGTPQLDEAALTPGIARLVRQARVSEQRIRKAIADAELPYDEVAGEVDRFVGQMEDTARRAQSLADALRDTPPQRVERRILEVSDDPAKAGLLEALTTQHTTLQRMQKQLRRFGDEMERILVEMDTIRSHIVSVGAATGVAQGAELAGEVRALRQQMGAVAEGMAAAYEEQP